MKMAAALPIIFLLGGCTADAGGPARFRDNGELIALSGGDAGAQGACITCHGLKGEGDGDLTPRLAGLDQGYLVRQLTNYVEGIRAHPQMRSIARTMNSDERLDVSAYFSKLPYEPTDKAGLTIGASLYAAECASCHGPLGEGTPGVPAIAGQAAAYVEAQFAAWRSGARRGDSDGTMTRLSRQWNSSQTRAVAVHVAALGDATGYPESPEACPPGRRVDPRNDVLGRPRCASERAASTQ
jgi:cytochrome c553